MPALEHRAFLYADADAFASGLLPFIRDGLEVGDPVCVVSSPSNVAALRESLADDARGVDFHDARDWYRQPHQTMSSWFRYVDRRANGGVVRVIGEPVWQGRTAASIREWTRYESAVNALFGGAAASIVCPYNEGCLPDDILEHALHTHPEVVDEDGPRPSSSYLDPPDVFALLADVTPPPSTADAITLNLHNLGEVRHLAARWARAAGLRGARLPDWILAVNELMTNGLRHGRDPVRLRLWCDRGELVAEVRDLGAGPLDDLAGWLPPGQEAAGGRGLWLVRQLADSVDFCRSNDDFAVRIRFVTAAALYL